jgi:hypothetical protein
MNCQIVQQKLLELEDPSQPGKCLAEHLRSCPSCRTVLARLQALEAGVRMLPVAGQPAKAKAACIERFLSQPIVSPSPFFTSQPSKRSLSITLGRWRWAGALAASLLLVALVGWGLRTPRPKPELVQQTVPADPFLASVVERQIQLSRTTNPSERVEALTGLANDLSNQVQQLARVAPGEDLAMLARLYERVVRVGLVKQAVQVPMVQRQQLLKPVADELVRCATRLEELAAEVPVGAEEPLREIVLTAREGNRLIQQLLTEEHS